MISTQARRLWLTHWDSCTYAPVLSPRLDSAVPSRHLVRFCAVVRFLCARNDLDSSVGYHPHLQLSDNFASSHRRFAYTALSLHSGSRIVFPKHGRGIVARWRRSRPQKSRSSSPIPQSVLPAHHGLSLHPPLHPPLHLHLFTALVAAIWQQLGR